MTIPSSLDLQTREWSVVDQRIPVPFVTGARDYDDPDWLPVRDMLDGPLAETRRFSSFRAFGDVAGGSAVQEDELTFDTRLVGRSAWNTRWMLIIPAATLAADNAERSGAGLDRLIDGSGDWDGIQDIKLHFQTFGFSGN